MAGSHVQGQHFILHHRGRTAKRVVGVHDLKPVYLRGKREEGRGKREEGRGKREQRDIY
jgi:hypothetical protein